MASIWASDRAQRFYAGIGLFGLAAIAIGFSTTYFIPVSRGTFAAPTFVHIHGFSAFSWVTLLFAQALLIRGGRTRLHMKIGQAGLPLAIAIWGAGSSPPPGPRGEICRRRERPPKPHSWGP